MSLRALVPACALLLAACARYRSYPPLGMDGPGRRPLEPTGIALLEDGRVVTVDRDYLVRSIVDPEADRPAVAMLKMPKNTIPAADVESIVDYLVSLG